MNLLLDLPDAASIRARLTPPGAPPILPLASSAAWSQVFGCLELARLRDALVRRARAELAAPQPALADAPQGEVPPTDSLRRLQDAYRERRRRLGRAQVALLAGPPAERPAFARSFLAKLESILDEPSWALPGHVADTAGKAPPCVDPDVAETAHLLAEALAVFAERVPAPLGVRVRDRLRSGVFESYLRRADSWFWPSCADSCNAVCHHGVLGAALAIEEDLDLVAVLLALAAPRLARFLDAFTADGGCAEGLDRWSRGFGSFAALNELLEIRTGGALSLFAGHARIRAIARFAPSLSLAGGRIVNFGDVQNIPAGDWVLAYLGRRLDEPACRRQAAENVRVLYLDPASPPGLDARDATFTHWQRVFRHAAPSGASSSAEEPAPDAFLPDLGVWVARGRDRSGVLWELAAKAGHNDERHNHNDVGSFILNIDGVPLLIEIGATECGTDFFHPEKRQGFLAARSLGHSLPVVNGREQAPGPGYRGEITRAESGRDDVVFEAELAAAYPAGAKLRRLTRRLELGKGEGELRLSDEFVLAALVPVESALVTDAADARLLSPRVAVIEKERCRLRLVAGADAVWDRVETHGYGNHLGEAAAISRLVLRPRVPARVFRLELVVTVASGSASAAPVEAGMRAR